ncbi:MAG: nucleotidyltransferase domain-containing protein [Candidatus Woesearchaeota archaeon]
MEKKLNILKSFFEDPNKKFSIRELSRLIKTNHTTTRQHLNMLVKEKYLTLEKDRIYSFYQLTNSKKTLNLKLYYNLEKIRKSKLIENLEQKYDYPTIVLFGSYSTATNYKDSDIDICIISDIKKIFALDKYEQVLNRKVSLHIYNNSSWDKLKKSNTYLVNNICNGIVLSGELSIL